MGPYIVGSDRRNRKLKEMEAQWRQKEIEILEIQRPVVKQVTTMTQALTMAKSYKEHKREESDSRHLSITGGQGHQHKKNKAPVDWNTFKY